ARPDGRVHADHRVRHRDGRVARCQGLRGLRRDPPRPLHRRGRCGGSPTRHRRGRRRAGPVGRVHGRVRSAARGGPPEQHRGACGGRQFDTEPGIAASNVIVEGAAPVSLEELLRTVRDGLYVGRIWYTYPINGLRAGDFTCTVVADSYIIRDGRLAAPLKANAIRINENIGKILNSIVGITKDVRGTIVWAADEVVYAPEIAVRGVRVDEIAAFMEELD